MNRPDNETAPCIHPSAIVDQAASIGPGVVIGPFCEVRAGAVLDAGVQLISQVVVDGSTTICAGTVVHPFAVLGGPPQHLRDAGDGTKLTIGAGCTIRENVSIHRGTVFGGGKTMIGANTMVMASAHVAHDCLIGENVVLATGCALGGHVVVGDSAFVGGVAGIHQFCRIGTGAFVGGCAAVPMDVIPYGSAMGNHARLAGLNLIGLKRAGMSRAAIHDLRAAYKAIFLDDDHTFSFRVAHVADRLAQSPEVAIMIDFIRADARRDILGAR